MYAFLNSPYTTLVFMLLALIAAVWGMKIRHPYLVNSPVRRALKRARKRDLTAVGFLMLALLAACARTL